MKKSFSFRNLIKQKEEQAKQKQEKKKGWKPRNQYRELGEDFDINQPYFVRAIEGDKCEVHERTHIGVPLIGEDQPPYDWREWVVPPKATPLVGGAAKSAPKPPS